MDFILISVLFFRFGALFSKVNLVDFGILFLDIIK